MKNVILFLIFAIGFMVALPSTSSGSKAPPGQVTFITDQSVDLTAMVTISGLNIEVEQSIYVIQTLPICRKGGDVVIQEAISDERHLNLCEKPVSINVNFNQYCITEFRLDSSISKLRNQNIQINKVVTHRFARDGLTQV